MNGQPPLRIVQITPGAGKMYCGACLRDNALVTALRKLGHQVQVRHHEGGLTAIRRVGDGWEGGADPRRDGVAKGE